MTAIKLDKIREEDIELLRQWRMSEEVTKYMLTDPVITKEQQLKWYQNISKDRTVYNWIIKYNDVGIGYISINNIDIASKSCEVGHYIGDMNCRGKGISKIVEVNIYEYVFEQLKLENIYFNMLAENKVAYHLHQSLGAKKVKPKVEECIKHNHVHKLIALQMTKQTWELFKVGKDYPKITIM